MSIEPVQRSVPSVELDFFAFAFWPQLDSALVCFFVGHSYAQRWFVNSRLLWGILLGC